MLLFPAALFTMAVISSHSIALADAIQDGSYVTVFQNGNEYVGYVNISVKPRTLRLCSGITITVDQSAEITGRVGSCKPKPKVSPPHPEAQATSRLPPEK
jgi:hypothetical protein